MSYNPSSGGGGGVSDGDKGDIIVSGSGATWTIDTGVVTLAKQADMATASVVYRKTAGAGAPEVQTLATLKSDLGLTGVNTGDQTSVTGNAGTATALQTARTLGITGDLVWTSPSFDGSANVTAAGTLATVNSNVGTYGSVTLIPVITVNAKGLVTAVSTVDNTGGWTELVLAADMTSTSTTYVDVTGLTFTPDANTDYEIEVMCPVTTTVITVMPRPGLAWGTGYAYGATEVWAFGAATTRNNRTDVITTAAGTSQAIFNSIPATGTTYLVRMTAWFRTGGTPTAFTLQFASETTSSVTLQAGAYLRYRKVG